MNMMRFVPACVAMVCLAAPLYSNINPAAAGSDGSTTRIVGRGPHHQVCERVTVVTNIDGSVGHQTNHYTALASGMHYLKDGQWIDAKEEVELLPDGNGAIARQGQMRVTFAANINTPGAITTQTPDDKIFRSHVLGLALTDDTTGKSVLIAPIHDSTGAIWKNQVLYRDAFEGINADILFVWEKGRFEQNIILREGLPIKSAADLGMNPDTTRLECWTEMVDAPEPTKEIRMVKAETDPQARTGMVVPDLKDETLSFGATMIGHGKAFLTEDVTAARQTLAATVSKLWVNTGGRRFLVERVELPTVQAQLDALPKSAAFGKREDLKALVCNPKDRTMARPFPSAPVAKNEEDKPMMLAGVAPEERGFVLDYAQVITATNFTFKAGSTYLVLSGIWLRETTTIEGSAVIKFTNSSSASVIIAGPIGCKTDPYNPAIFTSMHDDTVGDQIAQSTGNPTNWAGWGVSVHATNAVLKNVRFSHMELGLWYYNQTYVTNAQFVHCRWPIAADDTAPTLEIDNALFHRSEWLIQGGGFTMRGRHVTVNQCDTFGYFDVSSGKVYLTNSLLVDLTNWGSGVSYTTNATAKVANDGGIFQTVGAGSHYLATNSPYRNIGNTNLSAGTLAELAASTTFPPIVLSNTMVVNTTLTPQAERDLALPDLGYHYRPLDYAGGPVAVTNCTLILTGGVAFAGYANVGIWLQDGSRCVSEGSPTAPNHLCRFSSVQEQSTNWGNGGVSGGAVLYTYHYGSNAASAQLRFTRFDVPAGYRYHIYTLGSTYAYASLAIRDCEFNAGVVRLVQPTGGVFLTNNLFYRTIADFENSADIRACNNLFWGNSVYVECLGNWTFQDNVFDGSALDDWSETAFTTNSHNVYINTTGIPGRLLPTNAMDLVLTNFAWDAGPLGRFYQPTNSALINNGSITNAGTRGFYHYSVTTNGVKEANSTLDRGYHYVAVNPATGRPYDSDSDGVQDWAEDANGNGILDSGETDWLSAGDNGLGVFITRPRNGSILP